MHIVTVLVCQVPFVWALVDWDEDLNFSTWVMKNILFEQKMVKEWNKCHSVEHESGYAVCFKNLVNFPVAEIYKMSF
jgi:hypothetical protein